MRYLRGHHGVVPPTALSALVAHMGRSTNRSTAASPDPLILLLCVTSLVRPSYVIRSLRPSPEQN